MIRLGYVAHMGEEKCMQNFAGKHKRGDHLKDVKALVWR
jgi:hypothetical protein